jgi:hypothetical protein
VVNHLRHIIFVGTLEQKRVHELTKEVSALHIEIHAAARWSRYERIVALHVRHIEGSLGVTAEVDREPVGLIEQVVAPNGDDTPVEEFGKLVRGAPRDDGLERVLVFPANSLEDRFDQLADDELDLPHAYCNGKDFPTLIIDGLVEAGLFVAQNILVHMVRFRD